MTITVVWQEDGHLWCAADTRLVAGAADAPTTEIGSKIYAILERIEAGSASARVVFNGLDLETEVGPRR